MKPAKKSLMIRMVRLCIGIAASFLCCDLSLAQDYDELSSDYQQKRLRVQEWSWREEESLLSHAMELAASNGFNVSAQIGPTSPGEVQVEVQRGKKTWLKTCHWFTPFRISDENIYFVEFSSNKLGGTVVRYDMSSGAETWRTELQSWVKGSGHRVAGRRFSINVDDRTVTISCQESPGQWRAILNKETGKLLASRPFDSQ